MIHYETAYVIRDVIYDADSKKSNCLMSVMSFFSISASSVRSSISMVWLCIL